MSGIRGTRASGYRLALDRQWDLLTSVGAICARIGELPKEDVEHIRGWCDWLTQPAPQREKEG